MHQRREYNEERPKKGLGGLTPALYAKQLAAESSTVTPGLQNRPLLKAGGRRCYYNFVRPHGALKFGRETRTPAMQAGLATRRLTLRDIFVFLRRVVSWLSDVLAFADSRRTASAAIMYMPVAG